MTEKFTASNGAVVQKHSESLEVDLGKGHGWIEPWFAKALREFFRHEEDERLGRWRWPENPDYMVYPYTDDLVRVLKESSPGETHSFTRDHEPSSWHQARAARAYFDAHPEPKPWHDAKEGEVWLVGETNAPAIVYLADTGHLVFEGVDWHHAVEHAKTARRIYPEATS